MSSLAVCMLLMMSCLTITPEAGAREVLKMGELQISSSAFVHNGTIPVRHTCDGEDVSPPLAFGGVPAAARSLVLVVDDPDAPVGDWVHWVVWNIAPETRLVGEGNVPAGGSQGRNGWGRNGYGGPCPPSGTHRYFFKLYALDTTLPLAPGSSKRELERAMEGHVLARGELVGRYGRR
jgi:Raf kinase inhibitor-like YbhB/YbcL family protein